MTKHVNAIAVVLLLVSPGVALAQGTGPSVLAPPASVGPVQPGHVRIATRAPEPSKWISLKGPGRRTFKCRPLACPDQETVSFQFLKSPINKPDPRALEKLAKVDLPKTLRATAAARSVLQQIPQKVDTLLARTDKLKGFPAVRNETRYTFGKAPVFIDTAIIFAGPVMVRVTSISRDRALAKESLDGFVRVMTITEGPPLIPPGLLPVKPLDTDTTTL